MSNPIKNLPVFRKKAAEGTLFMLRDPVIISLIETADRQG